MNDKAKAGLSPAFRVAILAALAAALSLYPPHLANLSRLRAEARELERRISSLRVPARTQAVGTKAGARPGIDHGAMPETNKAAGPYEAASLLKTRLAGLGFHAEPSIRVESSGEIFIESPAPDAEPLSSALREIAAGSFPAAITGLSFRLEKDGALTLKLEAIHAR